MSLSACYLKVLCVFILLGAACTEDAVKLCTEEEAHGVYRHDSNNACGCTLRACPAQTRCFHGQCCDPVTEQTTPQSCGCSNACDPGQLCTAGQCCNPDESLTCTCDPMATAAQADDRNCGCRGACPSSAYCEKGVCRCKSSDEVICNVNAIPWGACVRQTTCICHADEHQTDASSCGCHGPCSAGQRCEAGACVCDSLAHAADNQNCGCTSRACDTVSGYVCSSGACICSSANLFNNQNCACKGACDTASGFDCRNGACICPSDRLYDSNHCDCKGPCATGQWCDGGRCVP